MFPNQIRTGYEIPQPFAGGHQSSQVPDANRIITKNLLQDFVWQATVIHDGNLEKSFTPFDLQMIISKVFL